MSHEQVLGLLIWVAIFYPVWSPRMNRIRRAKRQTEQRLGAMPSTVSRNTGPKWEQDVPYPECFEEDDLGDVV